jgi:DNA-binding transcriptional MerR regulator
MRVLTLSEVSKELNISKSTLKWWIRFNAVKPFRRIADGTMLFTDKEIANIKDYAAKRREIAQTQEQRRKMAA